MEVLKIKDEPFSDEEQDTLLDIKLVKNEETFTLSSRTEEADSLSERSSNTILKFGVAKKEQEENYDGETEIENKAIEVKTEQPGDVPHDEVISKFSDSDNNDLDSLEYGVTNMNEETEFQDGLQQICSGLESISVLISVTEIIGGSTSFSFSSSAVYEINM
ncbi:uncharacterized protein LOC106470082 isoform X5 [Limulus polyphemus]|uniref:Uncharacterized protein LOC106470082 isoform X5 n=1 Tax=Limulus polyphemus TaxID=6850 RepID=A0ABM1TEP0_LIMPO|nr:uncharacterized protein LOC106470082 isoform X5 [Limulus polyphemus]